MLEALWSWKFIEIPKVWVAFELDSQPKVFVQVWSAATSEVKR